MDDSKADKWVRVSDNRWRRLSRREFLKLGAAGAAGVGLAASSLGSLLTTIVRAQQRELRIMTWSHFVPAYDAWFDPMAVKWGENKGIKVTVDHVSFADIVPRANAEVAAQQGHDVYFFISPPSAFEQQALDLTDINSEAERRDGPLVPPVPKCVYNTNTREDFDVLAHSDLDPEDYLNIVWTVAVNPNRSCPLDD